MPKAQQYRAGSLIYFKGDPANQVFILQKGKVHLVYQDIETNEDQNDVVQQGEFFGVKSALGRYPREENAVAIQDANIMVFTVPEFESIAAANTRIIMKMLKVFSNQLRRVHRQVSSLMAKEEQNPEEGLFSLGQYYLKNRRFREAQYVFSRYLTYYPAGDKSHQAAKDLETAENYILKFGGGSLPQNGKAGSTQTVASVASVKTGQGLPENVRAYEEAVNLINQQKYQQAYLTLKKIVDSREDPEYAAKSSFEIGRCIYHLGKYDDCIKHYTMTVTKYPKHPGLSTALFYIGKSYENMNKKEQAVVFYKKILAMSANEEDEIYKNAKSALTSLGAVTGA